MKISELSKEELKDLMNGKGLGSGRGGKKGGGRKEELLNLLKEGLYSIEELSGLMNISRRNVSSLLSYNRDDGYIFKELGDRLVLWSVVRDGVKVKNRIVVGDKGTEVRFDFEKGCFVDEVKKEVKKEEVKKEEVKKEVKKEEVKK